MHAGAQAVLARPGLHRLARLAYPLVPGLRTRLRHMAAPPPRAPAAFGPAVPPAQGTLTVEHLYHLSRSL